MLRKIVRGIAILLGILFVLIVAIFSNGVIRALSNNIFDNGYDYECTSPVPIKLLDSHQVCIQPGHLVRLKAEFADDLAIVVINEGQSSSRANHTRIKFIGLSPHPKWKSFDGNFPPNIFWYLLPDGNIVVDYLTAENLGPGKGWKFQNEATE